jgi:hypothetical protein
MDTKTIANELQVNLSEEAPGVEIREEKEAVHVWWCGLYGSLVDAGDDFAVYLSLSDNVTADEMPREFEVVYYDEKGEWKYDEERSGFGLARRLIEHYRKREQVRFLRHPLFGRLMTQLEQRRTDLHLWSGHACLPFFGEKEVAILAYAPRSGPNAEQGAWFQEFLERQVELRRDLKPKLFDYYRSFREEFGDEILEIGDADAIYGHLRPSALCLGSWRDDEPFIENLSIVSFSWDCPWDPEHGVTAELQNWQFTEVGMG